MAGRVSLSSKETAIDIINEAGRTRLGRVQRAEIGSNLPNTQVQELGSDKFVGRVFDLPEVNVTVSAMDVGARNFFSLAGKNWATAASGTYVEAQDIQYACLVQTFKGAGKGNRDIARSLYVPGAKLDRFSLNYAVNSDLSEEFTFQATDKRFLKYDVVAASGVAGGITFSPVARILSDGTYVLSVFASGVGYLPQETILSSTSTTLVLDEDVVADGTPIVVTYHANLADQWSYTYEFPHVAPDYVPAPDQPVGLRGFNAEIYLVKSGVANERIYRAQTCTIQGQFPTQRVNELGSEQVVGYMDGIPDVTGTLEVMTSDFKLQNLLSGNEDDSVDNITPEELGEGDWGMLIKIFRRGVNRAVVAPEKSVWIPRLDITQASNNVQVGQDARESYQFASRHGDVYISKGAFTVLPGL